MKTGTIVFAVLMFILTCFGLPTGKQHQGISILAGKVSYSDGSNGYSILAYTVKDGRFLIKELSYSKSVNIDLLSKTLLNQDGFTQDQIKEYGFAIDQKARKVLIEGNIVMFKSSSEDPVKWEFSQKMTDSVTLFVPKKIKEKQIEAEKQVKKTEKRIKKKSKAILDILRSKKEIYNWAEKQ